MATKQEIMDAATKLGKLIADNPVGQKLEDAIKKLSKLLPGGVDRPGMCLNNVKWPKCDHGKKWKRKTKMSGKW